MVFSVQFFCVLLHPLLNIFCFCYAHPILYFIEPIFAWNVPLVSLIFLKKSLVFPILLFSSISLHWSLRKTLLFFGMLHSNGYIFPYLLCFSCLFFSQLFVRPPQTDILLFCISSPWGWSWSLSPVQWHQNCHDTMEKLFHVGTVRVFHSEMSPFPKLLFSVCTESVPWGLINRLSSLDRMWASRHQGFLVWGHVLFFWAMVLWLSKPAWFCA